jgi:hypothetical protein
MATFFGGGGGANANDIIAQITDSAPETLDTLNELAAALGDDPNFATTVSNELGQKLEASDLEGYATETYVGDTIAAIPAPDLTGKADLDEDGFLPDTIVRFSPVPANVAVAVGDGNPAYSLNSVDWIMSSMPSGTWVSIVNADDKFVAVGDGPIAAYSNDGISWRQVSMPASRSWTSVTYGDGKFVAVASDTNRAAYSLDGITWIESVIPYSYYQSVAYGDGRFVAVAPCCTTRAAFSLDGISWSGFSIEHSSGLASWNNVAHVNGNFIVLDSNRKGSFSSDGVSWSQFEPPSVFGGEGGVGKIAYGNGTYVMVTTGASSGSLFASSTNGTSWSRNQVISGFLATSVTYAGDRFVAVSSNGSLAYSTNGTSWTVDNFPESPFWGSITYGASQIRPTIQNKLTDINSQISDLIARVEALEA